MTVDRLNWGKFKRSCFCRRLCSTLKANDNAGGDDELSTWSVFWISRFKTRAMTRKVSTADSSDVGLQQDIPTLTMILDRFNWGGLSDVL